MKQYSALAEQSITHKCEDQKKRDGYPSALQRLKRYPEEEYRYCNKNDYIENDILNKE